MKALLFSLGFLLTLAGLSAAETAFRLPPETAKLKASPGVELVNSQCLLCHSPDYISTQPRLTQTQWKAVAVKMQQKYGAPLATNKIDEIAAYLAKNYGK